jgi:parallel beta-helix repeat protein
MITRKSILAIAIISILLIINFLPLGVNAIISKDDEAPAEVESVSNSIPEQISDPDINIRLVNRIFDPLAEQSNLLLNIDSDLLYSEPSDYSLIQFNGPVLSEWKDEVEATGADLLSYIPDYAFIARLPQDARQAVESLDSVRWVGPYHPYYKLTPGLAGIMNLEDDLQQLFLGTSAKYTIALFDTSTAGISNFKNDISGLGGRFHTIDLDDALGSGLAEVELTPEQLKKVSRMPEVSRVQPAPVLVTHNFKDSKIVDARQEDNGPFKNDGTAMWSYDPATDKFYGWTGSNTSVAVVDTGVDGTHPSFDGRKSTFFAYNWAGQWQDVQYHGTHVAGTVLGNGRWRPGDPSPGTKGTYAGIAPNASLIGQAYLGSGYSVARVMRDAARAGADSSSNSWGFQSPFWFGVYENTAKAYDGFVRDSTDGIPVNIMFSAGNDGPGSGTVSPPATAKNILCVGSTDDNTGTKVSGFSARGPLEDGRLKPDIVTPGAQVTSSLGNSAYSYAAFSGTSMACPGVAGGSAVVINYYQVEHEHHPSPALVKAVLLNGAQPLPGYTWPDNNQGWGRMSLTNSLLETDHKKFLFYDQVDRLGTNDEVTYEFNVAEESQMKIHLVWTDEPGDPNAAKALVNDLDLIVKAPTGETYYGNQFYLGQSLPGGSADRTNNVEGFALNNPGVGKWTFTVRGANVPDGPQDFAVIISGPVWEDMLDISIYDLGSEPGTDVFEGEDVVFNASLKNTGTLKFGGSQYVLTDYRPDGTSRKLLVSKVGETHPGGFFNFSLEWIADVLGTHRLVLSIDPLDAYAEANETNNIDEMYITVNSFGVRLDCAQSELGLQPGAPAQLTVAVHNTGTVKDNYQLALSSVPPGWTAAFNTTNITVGEGAYQNVTLQLNVPLTEKAGYTDGLTLLAQSSRAPEFASQQCFSVKVGEVYGFEMVKALIEKDIQPGGSVSYDIPVRNTGNADLILKVIPPGSTRASMHQSYELSEGWSVELSTSKLMVPYNGSANFTVTLSSPGHSLAGHVESLLIALAVDNNGGNGNGNGESEYVTCTLNATVLQYFDFDIQLKSSNMEVEAGKIRRLEFSLVNNGNGWDTFEFDAIVPYGWGYTFSSEELSVNAFGKADVKLNLKVSADALAGTYNIALKTVSHCDLTKVCGLRMELVLVQKYNVRMVVENQVVIVPVDSSLILPLHVINDGNGNDTVTFEVNWFDNFIMFSNQSVTVKIKETKTVNALIHIPYYFSPSNHTVELSAVSEDGETAYIQEIKVLVVPAQVMKKPEEPQPDINVSQGADADVKSAGLFNKGWYFDIFIIVLIIFIIIAVLVSSMLAIEKKYDNAKAQKEVTQGRRTTIATAAARGAAGGPGVMREVTVVRKKREYNVVRKQKQRRLAPPPSESVPALPGAVANDGTDVYDAEIADAEVMDAEDTEGAEESEESEVQRLNNGNGKPPYSPFISIMVVFLVIISGFGVISITDTGLETVSAANIQGNIYNDTVWSENMTLTGHTTVQPGVTLRILPGVFVYFNNGVRLNIAGTLYANGTANNTITFTSVREKPGNSANPWKGIWNRIQFNGSSAGGMNYCEVRWGTYAVIFDGTNANRVENIHIENTTFFKNRNGIYLYDYANYNIIKNNTIYENGWGYGIHTRASGYNYYEDNNLTDNTYNFHVSGWAEEHFTQYFNGSTNTGQGRPMYYYVNEQDLVVPEDAIFVGVVGSTNITIRNITAEKGGEGIVIAYSDYCTVDTVTVKNNNYGVYLYQAGDSNLLTKVTATSNSYGVYLQNSYRNILRDCNLGGNTYSIYIVGYDTQRFDHDIDTSNKVESGKPIHYYVNEVNKTVPSNAGFVGLASCKNITVNGIDSRKNAQGIMVAFSEDIHIESVYLYKNYFGTYYYRNTGKITLSNSTIIDNRRGSWFFESNDATFRNTLYDINYDAFEVSRSKNIRVTNSSIVAANRWNINMYGWSTLYSTVILLNTSFNPNKIRTVTTGTTLTVKWFMNVKAYDDIGNAAACSVTVTDGLNNVVADKAITGALKYIECVGYQQTPSLLKYQYNNYTVEARDATRGVVRDINMTYSRDVEFIFNSKPTGLLPEFLDMDEDGELVLDLSDYFTDANKLTYTTYVYRDLDIDINNAQDSATITATPDFCGQEIIIIRVIDEHGEFIESTTRVNVTPVNDAPYFVKPVPNIHLFEGKNNYYLDLTDYIDDPDKVFYADATRWYIEDEDARNITVIGENGSSMLMGLSVDDPNYNGNHKLKLVLEDAQGAKAEQYLWLNITERNDAPVLSVGNFNPVQGDTDTEFEFTVTYTDIEGDLPNTVQLILDDIHYIMSEQDISDRDTSDGKLYYYKSILGVVGQHRYAFSAADINDASTFTTEGSGPYVTPITPTTGDMEGKIIDSQFGLSLAGASITLYYANNGTAVDNGTLDSDTHGFFGFSSLAPGFYLLDIELAGYERASSDSVLIKPGELTTDGLVIYLDLIAVEPAAVLADTGITDIEIDINYPDSEQMAETDIIFSGAAADADGDTLIFFWDFEDGSHKPVGEQATHNFTLPGMYNITLTVMDADGNIATAEKTIVLAAQPVIEAPVVKEEEVDQYGNFGWMIGSIALIGILLALLPLFLFYRKRRKRGKVAAKKLKVLKKQMELKAAVAAQQMPAAYAQTIEAEQISTVEAVPQVAEQQRPALPPAMVEEQEADGTQGLQKEGGRGGFEERGGTGPGVQAEPKVVPTPMSTPKPTPTPMPSPVNEPVVMPKPVTAPEPVVGPAVGSDIFTFKKPDAYTEPSTESIDDSSEYECPGCGAGIAEADIKCPNCGVEFEE